jgi:two-component system response regulator PhoP
MRVLLLTNLASLAALASPLSDAGHGVEHCRDVADFDQFVDCYPFDAVVIDAGMPGLSTGMFLTRWRARAARRASARLPGLVIAAPGGSPAADLLRAGADDVLRRPLDADEYLARLDAVSRRAVGLVSQKARLGNAEIDFDEKALRVAGNRIALTAGQFSFVAALARRRLRRQ